MRVIVTLCALALLLGGCADKSKQYGLERRLSLPAAGRPQVWAVAPAVNLSGQAGVDPLLQADLVFAQLGTVRGITAVPVNRVVQAYAGLGITGVGSPGEAEAVCKALGVDALIVPTVTLWDPYDPPTIGAALQVYPAWGTDLFAGMVPDAQAMLDLTRSAREAARQQRLPTPDESAGSMIQESGVFDASHGSTRLAAVAYASGRTDPGGPAGDRAARGVFLVMDRYAGFVYHALLAGVMEQARALDSSP